MGLGSIEERLIRLMVWVGAKLQPEQGAPHNLLDHPIDILRSGSAWCDQQVRVFAFFANHFVHVDIREISMLHADDESGHTVCEAIYGGACHLFDVDSAHQAIYRDPSDGRIMSHREIAANPEVVESERHWWKSHINGMGKIGFYAHGGKLKPMHCQNFYPWENLVDVFR